MSVHTPFRPEIISPHVVILYDHTSKCVYYNTSNTAHTSMGFTAFPRTAAAAAVVVMATATLFCSSPSSSVQAFVAPSSQIQLLRQYPATSRSSIIRHGRGAGLGMKYVPDGLSPEQWKKMQKEEAAKKKKMGDLGQVSPALCSDSAPPSLALHMTIFFTTTIVCTCMI